MSPRQDNSRPDDETLVAYADGQLDASRAAEVERYLEGDAEAREFVELLRESGALARNAFNEAMDKPLPAGLEEMILGKGAEKSNNVVAFKRRAPLASPARRPAFAMAASLALVACGAFAISLLTQREDGDQIATGPLASGSALATLLETKPTGEQVRAGDHEITLVATFQDKESRPCREFESHAGGANQSDMLIAVACRSGEGAWTVVGTAQIAATSSGSGQSFNPASGNLYPDVDALLKSIGAGTVLTPAEEEALIGSGWAGAPAK